MFRIQSFFPIVEIYRHISHESLLKYLNDYNFLILNRKYQKFLNIKESFLNYKNNNNFLVIEDFVENFEMLKPFYSSLVFENHFLDSRNVNYFFIKNLLNHTYNLITLKSNFFLINNLIEFNNSMYKWFFFEKFNSHFFSNILKYILLKDSCNNFVRMFSYYSTTFKNIFSADYVFSSIVNLQIFFESIFSILHYFSFFKYFFYLDWIFNSLYFPFLFYVFSVYFVQAYFISLALIFLFWKSFFKFQKGSSIFLGDNSLNFFHRENLSNSKIDVFFQKKPRRYRQYNNYNSHLLYLK